MKKVITRSFLFTILAIILVVISKTVLKPEQYIIDVGGISAFTSVFGTLYGIIAAFVVFEVWGQFNQTSHLIEKEAMELERLFRLTLYFKNQNFKEEMEKKIEEYAKLVIDDKFLYLGSGERHTAEDKAFRRISHIVRKISCDNEHDRTVFDHIVAHYGDISELRTERINHCLLRLPFVLKSFLYISSSLVLIVFIVMPFVNIAYHSIVVGTLSFVLSMVLQMIDDLDNPFAGNWTVSPEPFERALKHMDEDYNNSK